MEDYFLPNFTQAPNYFFDVLLNQLSSTEVHVMCAIIRKTYGWHKAEDKISFSQLTKATGLALSTVQNAIKKLVDKGIVVSKIVDGIRAYSFIVNKEHTVTSKEFLPDEQQNNSYIPNGGIDNVQNNSYIPDSGIGVYRIPVTPPYRQTVTHKERLQIKEKTASTCVREAGAASLQKISFDRNTSEFVNGEELMPFFESKYKQRFESMQKSIEDVYFEACEVAKKIELRNAGAFLDSFFRDRAFPWIRNEAKKNHEKSLTEEILKQGRANYDLYCSFPYNNLLEFRDLHVKIKNRDSECYVYANPEVFQDFMYKAYSMNKEV